MTDDHKRKIRVAREATNRDMETHTPREKAWRQMQHKPFGMISRCENAK